jgi:hypothetical protein
MSSDVKKAQKLYKIVPGAVFSRKSKLLMVGALMVRVKREMKLVEEHQIFCTHNDLHNSDAVSQHRIPGGTVPPFIS